ncbi:hypothetical protein SCH01S_16_01550 [Sphingomonas changbaiensis NBRC 104936]|uniref:DUF3618 domain-containing protein n=1 Tax=Sphingomonas changbaiensis NBRC 104936 TaxID=1219043 RepID=A0A0E9MMI9_9SPHN|nr:DUF3618 domain-containing protein [Sphingomonas changbaiensis]GAO38636.1 hypothetical protein SCH01S_16_01550 [Sphingomonas changbaiensis NBRC 104936]
MSKAEVQAKASDAADARDKFMATLHELQHRLSPKTIAHDVKEKAKEKADGVKAAAKEGAVQAATHPSTVAAITVPILVYLFRKPIGRGLNALFGRGTDETPATQPYEEARAPAPLPTEPIRARPKAPAEQGA